MMLMESFTELGGKLMVSRVELNRRLERFDSLQGVSSLEVVICLISCFWI